MPADIVPSQGREVTVRAKAVASPGRDNARRFGSVQNTTEINVEANYTNPEEPQSLEMDLEAIRMVTES